MLGSIRAAEASGKTGLARHYRKIVAEQVRDRAGQRIGIEALL